MKVPYPSDFYKNLFQIETHHWWFLSRLRVILWAFKKFCNRCESFHEIGCGTGFILKHLTLNFPHIDLKGSEYFEDALQFARLQNPSSNFNRLNAKTLNEFESIDSIGAFDVLEHIDDDTLVLKNFYRSLKENGILLLTVPQHKWLWSNYDVQSCHQRRYSKSELQSKLKNAGFKPILVSSFVFFLLPFMILSRIFHSDKPLDEMKQFQTLNILNFFFKIVMSFELFLINLGIKFPIGGSLLIVARKRN